jgi:hypothetical protein
MLYLVVILALLATRYKPSRKTAGARAGG